MKGELSDNMIPVKDILNTVHPIYNNFHNSNGNKHDAMKELNQKLQSVPKEVIKDEFFQDILLAYTKRINTEMDEWRKEHGK